MTSTEIKNKVIEIWESNKDSNTSIWEIYNFFCESMKEGAEIGQFKAYYYKWKSACDELKEKYPMIDDTFPQVILCAHAKANGEDKRAVKRKFGWDIDKVLNSKMCAIAKLLVNLIEIAKKSKEQ